MDDRPVLEAHNAAQRLKRTAPSFTFGMAARHLSYADARTVGPAQQEEPNTCALPGPGAYELSEALVTRSKPGSSFGKAPRGLSSHDEYTMAVNNACAAQILDDRAAGTDHGETHTQTRQEFKWSIRGGVIGRAARFETGACKEPTVPFSPSASTVLSDAATDIADLKDLGRAADAVRTRAPSATIMPERSSSRSQTIRQRTVEARLGPGKYSPNIHASIPRAPATKFAAPAPSPHKATATTPNTEQRSRRMRNVHTPGPGSYSPSSSVASSHASGAAWSKLTGRQPSNANSNGRSDSANCSTPVPGRPHVAGKPVSGSPHVREGSSKSHVPKQHTPTASFGSAPRKLNLAAGDTAGVDVPFYPINFALVERGAKGGSFGKPPAARTRPASRRATDVLRNWKARSAELDSLLRGEVNEAPIAPQDVTRRSISSLVRYKPPSAVLPPHPPLRQHPTALSMDVHSMQMLFPDALCLKPRSESYSFGRLARRLPWPNFEAKITPSPSAYSLEAARAKLELVLCRVASAVWSRMTSTRLSANIADKAGTGKTGCVIPRKQPEGDVLILDVMRSLNYTKPVLSGFKMLLPSSRPRRALVPLPPYPPLPQAPVLLIPSGSHLLRHVPTPTLSARRHRQRSRSAEAAEIWESQRETTHVDWLSLDAADAAFSLMERRVLGGSFSATSRFEVVRMPFVQSRITLNLFCHRRPRCYRAFARNCQ